MLVMKILKSRHDGFNYYLAKTLSSRVHRSNNFLIESEGSASFTTSHEKVLLAIFYSFPDDYKISGRPGSVEEECDNKLPRRVLATADAR